MARSALRTLRRRSRRLLFESTVVLVSALLAGGEGVLLAAQSAQQSSAPQTASDASKLSGDQFDRQFLLSWRNDLLDRTWGSLNELERSSGQPHHTILRLRVDEPNLTSTEWAARLSERLGRPMTAGAFRQALQRARREFALRLLAEVRASLLEEPTPQALEEELADLELLEYCRPYLKRSG